MTTKTYGGSGGNASGQGGGGGGGYNAVRAPRQPVSVITWARYVVNPVEICTALGVMIPSDGIVTMEIIGNGLAITIKSEVME